MNNWIEMLEELLLKGRAEIYRTSHHKIGVKISKSGMVLQDNYIGFGNTIEEAAREALTKYYAGEPTYKGLK